MNVGENEENEYQYKLLGYWNAPKTFQILNHPIAYTIIYLIFAAATCKFTVILLKYYIRACTSLPYFPSSCDCLNTVIIFS